MQQRVGDLISDPNNTQWSTSRVQDKLNEAQEKFAVDTQSFVEHTTFTALSSGRTISLPTNTINFQFLYDSTNNIPLTRKPYDEVLKDYGTGWQTVTSTTPSYYWVDLWPSGKQISIWPLPSAYPITYVGDVVMTPQTMSSDGAYPFTDTLGNVNTLFNAYHMACAYFAASEFLRVDPTAPNMATLREYSNEYDKMVANCVDFMKSLQYEQPMRMRGGRYFTKL